jgi:hypothetical protein
MAGERVLSKALEALPSDAKAPHSFSHMLILLFKPRGGFTAAPDATCV